jgi:hypothetical protein
MSELQTPDEGTETTEQITPQVEQEPVAPQSPIEDATPESPAGEITEDVTPEPQPELVLKEKFVASQRESILNAERVKVRDSRIEQLTKQDTPTDEAMRQLYPEWDQLDDYNKRVLVRQETIAMQQARTLAKQQELDDRLKLEDQLETVIEDPKFSKLKGREAEFKRFSMKPANRGINAEVLAQAFLFDASEDAPTAPAPRTEALPQGSGGPRDPLKPKKISIEEAKKIRETDNKRYMELAKAGMIDDEV